MRSYQRTSFIPCLILVGVAGAGAPREAYANLLMESEAGATSASDWDLGLDLRLGAFTGTRDQTLRDDSIKRYHGAIGLPVRYKIFYVVPDLQFQYVRIETTKTAGQLRSAKLHSENSLDKDRVLHNLAVGGSAGAVVPSSVLGGFEALQLGAFVEGRTTLTETSLTFDELRVLYQGRPLDMKDIGNNGAVEVTYRWWTVAEGAFLTLRMSESLLRKTPLVRALSRPLAGSALSLAAGMLHFRLDVDVEVSEHFRQYVTSDQSQRVSKDELYLKLRFAVPLGKRFVLEVGGSATKQNGDLLYTVETVLGFRS